MANLASVWETPVSDLIMHVNCHALKISCRSMYIIGPIEIRSGKILATY